RLPGADRGGGRAGREGWMMSLEGLAAASVWPPPRLRQGQSGLTNVFGRRPIGGSPIDEEASMFPLLARVMVKRSLRAHLRGDVEALLKTYAKDVRFRFPGTSSWAGEFRGVDAVRPWLERFHRVGLKLDVDEILIGGWPWNTKVAVHFTDR